MVNVKELFILIVLIYITQTTGKSITHKRRNAPAPKRGTPGLTQCRSELNGQCMHWRNHTKCPQNRQNSGTRNGCAENEFCCSGPLRPLIETPRTYQWYDSCGTQNIQQAVAAPGNKSKMAPGMPLTHELFIVGGSPAAPGQFPWQASVLENGVHLCGGSLIDDQFILTAAHCIGETTGVYEVVLGSLHALGEDQNAVRVAVSSVHIHPGYKGTYEDDIALFKLERSVAEEIISHNNIMPACSPRTQLDHVGRNGLVAGWGKTGYPIGPNSDSLLYAEVPIIDRETCCQYHCDSSCNSATCNVYDYNICAGHETGGIGTCSGDSGGPLVVSVDVQNPRYHLVGVVSWNTGCALERSPTVFVDVRHFLQWIDAVREEYG